MTLSAICQAAAQSPLAIHLVQWMDGDSVYDLDISYDLSDPLSASGHISCVDKCKSDTTYSDTISFILLGAFGDTESFITLWASGSADWIIIYRVHDGVVTKVLQQSTRSLPVFVGTPDGRRVIVLHNDSPGMYLGKELYGKPPGLTKADRKKIRQETTSLWLWNGTTYVPYHGPVLGGWETIK